MILLGDCLEQMKALPSNSVDAIVCDPPYGLSFMSKRWDYDVPSVDIWREAIRVLKPGGHLLAFGGTRTYHRLVVAIEDAGFEIRDQIQWLYGSGFPKSHNLPGGVGTALKPANEPICLARKPLSEKTVALNVLKWGTGGLNIDVSRVGFRSDHDKKKSARPGHSEKNGAESMFLGKAQIVHGEQNSQGRWPANLILDEGAAEMLDEQSGDSKSVGGSRGAGGQHGKLSPIKAMPDFKPGFGDSGGASRFFYCAKASKSERNFGNFHPTVKPIKLMEYLIKLVTPPKGTVLDPFMGSGTTGVASKKLGFDFVGIEMNEQYFEIAKKRIEAV